MSWRLVHRFSGFPQLRLKQIKFAVKPNFALKLNDLCLFHTHSKMNQKTKFSPPIKACLFDMDGLLLGSELIAF